MQFDTKPVRNHDHWLVEAALDGKVVTAIPIHGDVWLGPPLGLLSANSSSAYQRARCIAKALNNSTLSVQAATCNAKSKSQRKKLLRALMLEFARQIDG